MSKPSILFVDDEPNLIGGLRRFTRPKRDVWNLLFAEGGEEALEIIRAQPIDVLVTDMRMPGLDGANLLRMVSTVSPGTIRLILSGEASADQAASAVGKSHRFLAKPCDPALLVSLIEELLEKRDHAGPEMALEAGSVFDRMAIADAVLDELRGELDKENADPANITRIIEQDACLIARLLQIVNSAYFGRPTATCSTQRAVQVLGLERLRDLVSHERFGPPASTAGVHVAPVHEAVIAQAEELRAYVTRQGGSAEAADTAFAIARLPSLVHGTDERDIAHIGQSTIFVSVLLGLPAILSTTLSELAAQQRSGPMDRAAFAERVASLLLGNLPNQQEVAR